MSHADQVRLVDELLARNRSIIVAVNHNHQAVQTQSTQEKKKELLATNVPLILELDRNINAVLATWKDINNSMMEKGVKEDIDMT